jgi:ribokinase
MGEQGTLLWHQGMAELIPPVPVTAVDSTAAGDAFAGAVAVRWAESGELTEAIAFGNAAGAWSAAHHGAQPSMGGRDDIETLRSKKS